MKIRGSLPTKRVVSLLGLLGKGILLMNSMYCEPGSYNLLLSHKV